MEALTAYLQELNMGSLLLRLLLAMLFGGLIGLERGLKRRAAGFRTYMLVCLGATLAGLLAQYEHMMLTTRWADTVLAVGGGAEVSRLSASVIGGIGFLGAGTILVTPHQEVEGVTTAAGLFTCACMGIAIGAGFYACVLIGFPLVFICIWFLPRVEAAIVETSREMDIYVEFRSVEDIGDIINRIKALDVQIYDVEIDRRRDAQVRNPSAVFSIRLNNRIPHTHVMSLLSELECIKLLDEI